MYSLQTILYLDHPAMYHVKQQRYKVMWVPIIKMENQRSGVDTEESGTCGNFYRNEERGEREVVDVLCWNHTKETLARIQPTPWWDREITNFNLCSRANWISSVINTPCIMETDSTYLSGRADGRPSEEKGRKERGNEEVAGEERLPNEPITFGNLSTRLLLTWHREFQFHTTLMWG